MTFSLMPRWTLKCTELCMCSELSGRPAGRHSFITNSLLQTNLSLGLSRPLLGWERMGPCANSQQAQPSLGLGLGLRLCLL